MASAKFMPITWHLSQICRLVEGGARTTQGPGTGFGRVLAPHLPPSARKPVGNGCVGQEPTAGRDVRAVMFTGLLEEREDTFLLFVRRPREPSGAASPTRAPEIGQEFPK